MATQPNLRIGDSERNATAAELSEHYAHGRLTLEEFNQRLDATYAAKTQADLSRITADLPHVRSGGAPLPSARTARGPGWPGASFATAWPAWRRVWRRQLWPAARVGSVRHFADAGGRARELADPLLHRSPDHELRLARQARAAHRSLHPDPRTAQPDLPRRPPPLATWPVSGLRHVTQARQARAAARPDSGTPLHPRLLPPRRMLGSRRILRARSRRLDARPAAR